MAKTLSLGTIVKDIIEGLDGPELSWDIKIDAHVGHFDVSLPIRFFGERKGWLDSKVRDVAKKHGLSVYEGRFRGEQHDIVLEARVTDFKMVV